MARRRKSNSSNRNGGGQATPEPQSQSSSSSSSAESGSGKLQWYKVDLHLHTPASDDYEQPRVSYLEWLRRVAEQELDVVAITDHNTVEGVAKIRREIEWLSRLYEEGRLNKEEEKQFKEWQDISNKVVVLPGFEFTATFGFHILGIFPPDTSVRELEHILLRLNVPADKLEKGSTETGASTDVISAYRIITQAGGMAIAAHANSTHGVAMRNFPFGGQTKIAYTQDENLLALEVTDLDNRSRRSTARFFNGSKPEYPRKMHCIQGSDAHRLTTDPRNPKRLGIGERATEMLLAEPSFEAMQELLASKWFDRTRPLERKSEEVDHLETAREEGPNQVQSFHESATKRGGRQAAILSDICAFANTDGGVIYLGAKTKGAIKGLPSAKQVQKELQAALAERMTPQIEVKYEVLQSQGAQVLRLSVPEGYEKPYCVDGSKFYVRNDAETGLAVRDEIVALVLEAAGLDEEAIHEVTEGYHPSAKGGKAEAAPPQSGVAATSNGDIRSDDPFYTPQMGVELVGSENRGGVNYYVVRDMRNGRTVSNVTRKGARKLWNYAIAQHEDHPVAEKSIKWKGDIAMLRSEKRAGKVRYDLILRDGKNLRFFYGVTEDGMEGPWAQFVGKDS